MSNIPTLTLSPGWQSQEIYPDNVTSVTLGDGYSCEGPTSIHPNLATWEISRVGLRREEIDEIIEQLKLWGGITAFLWSPLPGKIPSKQYFADTWSVIPLGPDVYEIQIKLQEDAEGECQAFAALIDETAIASQLIGASSFLTSFTNDSTYLINSDNNLALRTLHTHNNQIPSDYGTLYDQLTLAIGCLNTYELTNSNVWLNRAIAYGQAILENYYVSPPIEIDLDPIDNENILTESGEKLLTESGSNLLLESES